MKKDTIKVVKSRDTTENKLEKANQDKVFTRAFFEVVQTHMVCQFMMSRSSASIASDTSELQRNFFYETEDW